MKLVLIICLCVTLSGISKAHKDGAYMRNANDGFKIRKDWMKQVRDDIKLCELALPGSQGSASYDSNYKESDISKNFLLSLPIPLSFFAKSILIDRNMNQALNLKQQLDYGIRVFEIRLQYVNNKFGLMQGGTLLVLMFDDLLNIIADFLAENPSETVLFSLIVEKEHGKNEKSRSEKLNEYLQRPRISGYYLRTKDPQTTLNDAREKFVILSRETSFDDYGIKFYSSDFSIMDICHLTTNWGLYKKWKLDQNHLNKAINGNSNTFYVTFLSGWGGPSPYFVASGHSSRGTSAPRLPTGFTTPMWSWLYPDFPRVRLVPGVHSIVFEGTNILTRDKIQSYNQDVHKQKRTVRIIMASFIGDSLIETTIQNNALLYKTVFK